MARHERTGGKEHAGRGLAHEEEEEERYELGHSWARATGHGDGPRQRGKKMDGTVGLARGSGAGRGRGERRQAQASRMRMRARYSAAVRPGGKRGKEKPVERTSRSWAPRLQKKKGGGRNDAADTEVTRLDFAWHDVTE